MEPRTDTPQIDIDQSIDHIKLLEEQNAIKMTIKELVREYVENEDIITKARNDLKLVSKRRDELQDTIVQFMKENNINSINISNGQGRIKLNSKIVKKALNRQALMDAIQSKIDPAEMEHLLKELEDQREAVEVDKIKLVKK